MEAVFLKIVNMSITAGWVALAVMLARVLFKKVPKGLICCLWALVALRLILPFSFESIISLIPSTETLPQEFLYATSPEIDSGIPSINSTLNPIISQSLTPEPWGSANPTQILSAVFSWLWVLGMVVLAIYTLISYLRIRHRVRASIPMENGIYLCDDIDTPFILGILRPRIYLPGTTDELTMNHVLAHERAHLKRYDHLWKPLGFLLLTVHWFNPVLWIAYILLCRDIELACDEQVIRELDTEEKKAYSTSLLQCSIRRPIIAACPLAFGEVGVKQRIKSILSYRKPAFWIIPIGTTLGIVLALCFLTDPVGVRAQDIVESRGYENLVHCRQTIDITIPLSQLPANFMEESVQFRDEEIVVYQTPTSTVFLKTVQPGSQGRVVEFYFDISYDLSKVGTMLCTNYFFEVEDGIGSGNSVGPNQEFGFSVYTELLQGDSFTATVTMNQLTYAKRGHAPKLHNGGTNVDRSYFNWVYAREGGYELRLNDLGMIAFAQPYQEFAAMTVDFAEAIAYLQDKYNLDPIEPFRYEDYKKYGMLTYAETTELDQACMAVSQILSIYENSFKNESDAIDTPITKQRIPDGDYRSGETAFWNPLSSWYYAPGDMMMTVNEGVIRLDSTTSIPHLLLWQKECPIGDDQLAEFYKVYSSINAADPSTTIVDLALDDRCVYQPIDQTTFLAKQDDRIYLVSWNPGAKPIALIWFIVEMLPE